MKRYNQLLSQSELDQISLTTKWNNYYQSIWQSEFDKVLLEILNWLKVRIIGRKMNANDELTKFIGSQECAAVIVTADSVISDALEKDGYLEIVPVESILTTPFEDAVEVLCERLAGRDKILKSQCIPYEELLKYLTMRFAVTVAKDPDLQSLEDWNRIAANIELVYDFWFEWLDNIPLESIQDQKEILLLLSVEFLKTCIGSYSYRSNNISFAEQYEAIVNEFGDKSSIEFVHEATRNWDTFAPSNEWNLRFYLCRRLGKNTNTLFLDNCRYPIVQKIGLYRMRQPLELLEFLRFIVWDTNTEFMSDREHLFIMGINTLFSLMHDVSFNLWARNDIEIEDQAATDRYTSWLEKDLPDLIVEIKDIVVAGDEHISNVYFNLFFSQSAALTALGRTGRRLVRPAKDLRDTISNVIAEHLANPAFDRKAFLDQFQNLNWNSLEFLVKAAELRLQDSIFKKSILSDFYQKFLTGSNFSWDKSGRQPETNFKANIIGWLISSQENPDEIVEEWINEFKNPKEGWAFHRPAFEEQCREVFVLAVGAYVAQYHYIKGDITNAQNMINSVITDSINSSRFSETESDFVSPLILCGIILSTYENNAIPEFVERLVMRMDDLEHILPILHQTMVNSNVENIILSDGMKSRIIELIEEEFFVIEARYSDHALKDHLIHFLKLKEGILNSAFLR